MSGPSLMISLMLGSLRGRIAGLAVLLAAAIAAWAPAGAQALFTQCPPGSADQGCQVLITITNGGQAGVQDTTPGPYQASHHSPLRGQNNASNAISAPPPAAPG